VDQLLYNLDYKVYTHVLNIVFTLFAPIFFLSLTPLYPANGTAGTGQRKEEIAKAAACPKTLDVLVSYIIIPLAAVYTVILLAYVLINIRGEFWTDNLLEPMLVSYAVAVILIYILADSLDNPFAVLFKKVFPKILIPIVLFETVASIVKIGDMGLTHGRYYVIMFGIFAVIAGVIFSFFPASKNGWIAAVLIVFSAVSVIPPIDAFTVSRTSQTTLLQDTLADNGMIENEKIVPGTDVSSKDKKTITSTVSYLDRMQYTSHIAWIPDNIFYGDNFEDTFGFHEVYDKSDEGASNGQFANLDWNKRPALDIAGYDRMVNLYINSQQGDEAQGAAASATIKGTDYSLSKVSDGDGIYLLLSDDDGQELMKFDAKKAFNKMLKAGENGDLNVEQATVTEENDAVRMSIVANSVSHYDSGYDADLYVLIEIK
jgi:hypothetical protein